MRLGNWMFQFAAAMSVLKMRFEDGGVGVAFFVKPTTECRYIDALRSRLDILKGAKIVMSLPDGIKRVSDVGCITTSQLADRMPNVKKEDYLLLGCYQSAGLLNMSLCQQIFGISKSLLNSIKEQYTNLDFSKCVSISVRRGDYLRLPHRHPFVGRGFLRKAVAMFENYDYVVCSDDIVWCKKFFSHRRFVNRRFHFIETGRPLFDLYVPSLCHHNIISNSTFSWWGAYLNCHKDKRVIFPSMWFGIAIKDRLCSRLHYDGVEILENRYSFCLYVMAIWAIAKSYIGNILRKRGILRRHENIRC